MSGIGATSNYVKSLQNQYRYNYADTVAYKGFNTAVNPLYAKKGESGDGYVNSAGAGYLGDIQKAGKTFDSMIGKVRDVSMYGQTQAISGNTDALTIHGDSRPDADFSNASVAIHALAKGQANTSNTKRTNDIYEGATGYQQFEIEVGGKTTQIGLEIQAGSTNKQVMDQIASAINSKNIGVMASVSSSHGESSLTIQARGTGDDANNQFVLRDLTGGFEGGMVEALSLNRITQEAQDARYSVNGEEFASKTNTVDIGNGVKVTLKAITDEEVEITEGRDTGGIKQTMKDFVEAFNELYEIGLSNAGSNAKLQQDLVEAYNAFYKDMENVGITMSSDGLKINEDKLDKAIEDGSLEALFTANGATGRPNVSTMYSFTGRLGMIATNAQHNAATYAAAPSSSGYTPATSKTQENNYNWENDTGSTINKNNFNLNIYNNELTLGYFMDMLG